MSSKKFLQAFWRSSRRNKIGHDFGPFSTSQKGAVFEPKTRHFRELAGFEAKDLTFEAKDFKLCPGGLHLCFLIACIFVRYSNALCNFFGAKCFVLFQRKFSHACRTNRFFGYHKYYPVL